MYLPSKELVSKVLNVHVTMIDKILGSDIGFEINNISGSTHLINIYELAHKCKEWAYKQEYILESYFYNSKARCDISKSYAVNEMFIADTEPAAIFKACEWLQSNMKECQ